MYAPPALAIADLLIVNGYGPRISRADRRESEPLCDSPLGAEGLGHE
jgi:hypothetical protein